MPSLSFTLLTPGPGNPEFNPGISDGYDTPGNIYRHVYDFTRRRAYYVIMGGDTLGGHPVGGFEVTNLDTFTVIGLVSFNSMYAGTAFGSPWGQVAEVAVGNGTNVYVSLAQLGASPSVTRNRLVRVDPGTLKVTGEFYTGATSNGCIYDAHYGIVNQRAGADVVAYRNTSNNTLQVFNGATMAYLGNSTNVLRWSDNSGTFAVPGASNPDGSCDFWIISANTGAGTPVGAIDLFRVTVSSTGAIATVATGTVNGLAIWPGVAMVYAQRADWDAQHGHLILWVGGGADVNSARGAPAAVVAVTAAGAVVWRYDITRRTAPSMGSALLTDALGVLYDATHFVLLSTADGTVQQTYDVVSSVAWSGAHEDYISALSSSHAALHFSLFAFDFGAGFYTLAGSLSPGVVIPPPSANLALDNLVATVTTTLLSTNLIGLRWSDDRGHSWGSPVTQSIGEAGEYRTSLQWQRMGMARDRCFELSWSVPMRTALQGCWVDVTPASS